MTLSEEDPAALGTGEPFAREAPLQSVPGGMELGARPAEGAVLTARGAGTEETLRLGAELGRGGEGSVFATDRAGRVAKIYRADKLTCMKYEKLRRMVAHRLACPGICFPEALLYNDAGEFCGCLMPEAKGAPMQENVFALWKKGAENPFPAWTKRDTVELAITILEKIRFLHSKNILLGDINPQNILVASPTDVWFVDTDSYQVDGFPCPVGMTNFTPRELLVQGEDLHYDTFLRTMGHENFAIATLLFMIMVPGKPPYAMVGGESQRENIINGDFPYPCGRRGTGKAPQGRWTACWSQLPYEEMQLPFYETFRLGEAHAGEETRYTADDWLARFCRYRDLLASGRLTEKDTQALLIFPTRIKSADGAQRAILPEVEAYERPQGPPGFWTRVFDFFG